MLAFIVGFTIINISLWGVLLIKFKKIFSTDSIIEKSRIAMNKMVADINRNAETDINLSQEATKRMRIMLAEADKTMENFRQATDRLRDMIAEADKISKLQMQNGPVVNLNLKGNGTAQEKIASANNLSNYNNVYEEEQIDPNAAYELNIDGNLGNYGKNKPQILRDETKITSQGAAYKEVPVINSKFYNDYSNVSTKVPLSEKVRKLFNQGLEVQEIATTLSCSITEVQLIIDMF